MPSLRGSFGIYNAVWTEKNDEAVRQRKSLISSSVLIQYMSVMNR